MKMKFIRDEDDSDWYLIIRAEHDGCAWWERNEHNNLIYMTSERLSPEADIEGEREEMLSVAHAIRLRSAADFKCVSVSCEKEGVRFRSPKNSKKDVIVSFEEADDLAVQIFQLLGG